MDVRAAAQAPVPGQGVVRRGRAANAPEVGQNPPPHGGAVQRGAVRREHVRHHLGFLDVLGRMLTVGLLLSTGYQVVRTPREFLANPGPALMGAALFSRPVTQAEVEGFRRDFVKSFGEWIPQASEVCAGVPMRLEYLIPNVGGVHQPGPPQEILINRNHLPLWNVRRTVSHELLHACVHKHFREALVRLERRNPQVAMALHEGLTEMLVQRGLSNQNWFHRLMATLGVQGSGYTSQKLPNGRNWLEAAGQLIDAVSLETVARAYLGGEAEAIKRLMEASRETHLLPRRASSWTA